MIFWSDIISIETSLFVPAAVFTSTVDLLFGPMLMVWVLPPPPLKLYWIVILAVAPFGFNRVSHS